MSEPLILDPRDNVAILTEWTTPVMIDVDSRETFAATIQPGHKFARCNIVKGAVIRKFGQIIGYATEAIPAGAQVHNHNCSVGEHERNYAVGADLDDAQAAIPQMKPRTFEGYARSDGRVGTRNYIALCATVNCSATVIRQAADTVNRSGMLDAYSEVDAIAAFAHGTGCGMASDGPGWENLQRVLWGYATHPNIGAAIFVGLGCEVMQIARMKEMFDACGQERFQSLTIQDSGGTRSTIEHIVETVRDLLPQVNRATRTSQPASTLTVALQCGGSDGYSGITANPALGLAVDRLVGLGGTAILAETPEIYGAEQLLLRRVVNKTVANKLLERIAWWENYTQINGGSMDNNPSPGNKTGGLTTILEKSLGAVAKGGSTPLVDVLRYAEKAKTPGFVFMDSPGYDPVSVTGQIAGGAQIVVFTTGRGSAFGSKPAPTIKVASNDRLYRAMTGDMDINCGDILSAGVSLTEKADEILDSVLATASGKRTKSEELDLGDNEFLPWQIGAVM